MPQTLIYKFRLPRCLWGNTKQIIAHLVSAGRNHWRRFCFVRYICVIMSPGAYLDTLTPAGKVMTFATLASFACFALAVMISDVVFSDPGEWLVLTLPSLAASFCILFCSKIWPNTGRAKRVLVLFLAACLIFIGVLFLVGAGMVTTAYISMLLMRTEIARGEY